MVGAAGPVGMVGAAGPPRPGAITANPLRIGPITVEPPVVLAPMAGVTDSPFRRLCREYGAGLYVSEMIAARAVVARNPKTMAMIAFTRQERPRSLQLAATDPAVVGTAVSILTEEDRVDHIDLNFGCPVPKVTRRGGGSALPWKRRLFAAIVGSAVRRAGAVPVTVKLRLGIDDEHLTYLDAGRIAAAEGAQAVALHGRTAAQHYSGHARWAPIGELADALDGSTSGSGVPVLGNGDIWTAADAVEMIRATGCAGVVVGRGCMGRPWLFGDLAAAFSGATPRPEPTLHQVASAMARHADLLADWKGERHGIVDFRKHTGWYLKGFAVGGELRRALNQVRSLAELREHLSRLPTEDQPLPDGVAESPRGRTTGSPRRVHLPAGWLDSRDTGAVLADVCDDAGLAASGG